MPGFSQPVIAAVLRAYFDVLGPINLLDQVFLKERFGWNHTVFPAKTKTSARPLFNLANDCVSVQVAIGEGKQDLECCGG